MPLRTCTIRGRRLSCGGPAHFPTVNPLTFRAVLIDSTGA
jgi:hypothetical protein